MASRFDSTNVVRLPTAARHQVQQPKNRWGRAARKALKEAQPWPGEFMFPGQRAALRTAEKIAEVERTPALVVALALVSLLDEDARLRLIGKIAAGGGGRSAEQVLALLRTQEMTVGERVNLDWALEKIRG